MLNSHLPKSMLSYPHLLTKLLLIWRGRFKFTEYVPDPIVYTILAMKDVQTISRFSNTLVYFVQNYRMFHEVYEKIAYLQYRCNVKKVNRVNIQYHLGA